MAILAAFSATVCSGPDITPTLILFAAVAGAASAFFSSLQPLNANAESTAMLNTFLKFIIKIPLNRKLSEPRFNGDHIFWLIHRRLFVKSSQSLQ